jgi:CBS domain-containing protein
VKPYVLAIDIISRNPVVVKQDTEINEIIDIILQKAIILVPVINDERRSIGVVSRLDI